MISSVSVDIAARVSLDRRCYCLASSHLQIECNIPNMLSQHLIDIMQGLLQVSLLQHTMNPSELKNVNVGREGRTKRAQVRVWSPGWPFPGGFSWFLVS